jgi:hypothetical protein
MPQQDMRRPFRYETRQNIKKLGIVTYSSGAQVRLNPPIARVGLMSRLLLIFSGTVTTSGAGALTDQGPFNLLSRIKVLANLGAGDIWNTTGYGAHLMGQMLERGYRADLAGGGATTPDTTLYSAPVAAGANTWVLTWILPIGVNDGSEFEAGLIDLQAPEVQLDLELTFAAPTDVVTTATAVTGTVTVYEVYYEIPTADRAPTPPLMLHRVIEDQQPISTVGDNIYTVPRQGALLQLVHYVTLNGARSNSFDAGKIVFNKSTTVYEVDRRPLRLLNRFNTGVDFPTGVYAWDFYRARGLPSSSDNRDVIDAEELSTLESICQISSGATLGSNNNQLNSLRRIIQVFQA